MRLPLPDEEGRDAYEATFSFREEHQAAPGLVHGGLVAAALDEACGLLATWCRFPSVTARFAVRFLKPVEINKPLEIAAALRNERGRHLHIEGWLQAGDDVLAEADGAFIHVTLEHFLRTTEGRAARDYWVARLDDVRRDA